MVKRIKKDNPNMNEELIKSKLVAYTSSQSNSSVEKAGFLGSMRMKLLAVDEKCSLRGATLLEAIEKDLDAWIKDTRNLLEAFCVDRVYLPCKNFGFLPDYRHWQISLGRHFRSLKFWFVLRIYGISGIQKYIRDSISLAQYFESLVKSDSRFEVITERTLGLVCFRMKGENFLT
ncbi:hypothetical protein KQX54_009014 [Cotesia glomerata]|uniref:Uncharacterized protein n=1 Tax=Cotesia glomerata TaxID=32391 RepID=A0AAV7J486_COTGL|nr:hypothetical protein KQX54_009014 [Cotesia glomerata]